MKRRKLNVGPPEEDSGGSYFTTPKTSYDFIKTGSTGLDNILGGGWALGRIGNIVGDKSTGKTLVAIESCANFLNTYPEGRIFYNETEAAFDSAYAKALGIPINDITFVEDCLTVEDFFEHITSIYKKDKKAKNTPTLYVVDSLDALSDKAEMEREISKGSFGAAKAKKLSELFRRITKKIKTTKTCLLIVSQVRDNIGVMFGKKHIRGGGKALDFYASQVIWLSQTGKLTKTRKSVKRTIGITIKAMCDKNKIGLPFRECLFDIMFGYGIEDLVSNVKWAESIKRFADLNLDYNDTKGLEKALEKMNDKEYRKLQRKVAKKVTTMWYDIEKTFIPTRKKYRG